MKVLFLLRGETTPSSRHRVLGYLNYLSQHKIIARAVPIPKNFLRMFFLLKDILKSDIIVIQKKALHIWELYFLSFLRKELIYDLDDLVTERPKGKGDYRKNISREKRFLLTTLLSKHIIVGNEFLKKYIQDRFSHKNITIIPTPVDMNLYRAKENYHSSKIIIGWIGLPGNLLYLDLVKEPLKKLNKKYGNIALKIVSSHFIDIPGLEIIEKQWSGKEEIEDLLSFDIGIMPLFEDEWSQAKCGFKAIQCMGVGVPVVISPVGINSEIVRDGENGFLAANEDDWIDKLSLLIEDESLREKIGKAGRKTILEQYSFAVCAPRLKQVLEETAK